jgi:phosphoribulokinase
LRGTSRTWARRRAACGFFEIDGNVSREHAAELAIEETIWTHLPDQGPLKADQFGEYSDSDELRHSDPLALTQLLIAYHLLRAYSGGAPMPFAPPLAALTRLESATSHTNLELVSGHNS